jgi:hypothetical protein
MAEVTRRVIIEVETRQKKSRLEAPEDSTRPIERAFKAQAEASEKASRQIISHFRESGEGALRFSRGLALLSANGSEDLKKLVQQVAIAQGAFDVFAGGAKALTHLAAATNPVVAGIAAVTVAVLAGAKALEDHERAAERDAEQMRKLRAETNRLYQDQEAGRQSAEMERLRRAENIGGLRTSASLADESRGSTFAAQEKRILGERTKIENRTAALERELALSPHSAGGFSDPQLELKRRASLDPTKFGELLGLTQRAEQVGREQLEIASRQYEAQKDQLEEQRRAAQDFAGGLLGTGAGKAVGTFFNFQQDELAKRAEAGMVKIVDAIERAGEKSAELSRALQKSK